MADIDLKTETPDATLPSTGFLFGADSQAAASPSVYSVPVAAAALLSNAPNGSAAAPSFAMGLTGLYTRAVTARLNFTINGFDTGVEIGPSVIALQNTASLSWVSGTLPSSASDLFITRKGTANLRLGAADAAAPVAQTLSVQSVVAGTTNTAGANLTIAGAQGTGTGAGGSIVFQVAPAGSSGTAQNALATALTIASNQNATFAGSVIVPLGSAAAPTLGFGTTGIYSRANNVRINFTISGTDTGVELGGGVLALASTSQISWASGTLPSSSLELTILRDAANTLALRNGTNAQTFNVYGTFTDASNYERGFVRWNSNIFQVGHAAAGTGTTRNMALVSGSSSYAFNSNDIAIFPAAGGLEFSARARVSSPALGIIRLTENNGANAGSLELPEWAAAPAAPAANNVRIYAVDNGSGKTQLMALFATGAAQQIAIEP
jgi:hypothetical protein